MSNNASVNSNSLKTNVFFMFMVKVFVYSIPIITEPYLSRVFGPDGIGEYTYVYSIVSYFSLAVNFGFTGYGVKNISSCRNNKREYSDIFWSIVVTRCFLFLCSFFAYVILLCGLKHKYPELSIGLYLSLSLTIFSNLFDITYLFQALERIKWVSIINFIVRFVCLICIFMFVKGKNDLLVYAIIQSLQILFIAVCPWLLVKKTIYKPRRNTINLISVLSDAFYFFIPTLAVTLCSLIDKTMLGSMCKKSEVGYYEQADKMINVIIGVLHSFAEVFTSRISYLVYEKAEEEINKRIQKMFELYALVGLPAMMGLMAVGPRFIVAYFGSAFKPAVYVLYILLPLIVFKSLSNAIGNIYYGPRGLMWMTSIFYIVGSVINILLNAFLIPEWGAKGAATASFVSELLITCIFIIYSRKKVPFNKIASRACIPFISSIGMFSVISITDKLFNVFSIIIHLSLNIFIGLLIYCILIVVLREPLVIEELNILKKSISKKILSK